MILYSTRWELTHKPEAQAKGCPSLALQACVSIKTACSIITNLHSATRNLEENRARPDAASNRAGTRPLYRRPASSQEGGVGGPSQPLSAAATLGRLAQGHHSQEHHHDRAERRRH